MKDKIDIGGKSRFLSFILSLVPGLGHMYLGFMNKGIIIMGGFFFLSFLIGWLGLPLVGFILPVIWAYSVFDIIYIKHNRGGWDWDLEELSPEIKDNLNSKTMGLGLVGLGGLILLQKIVYPFIIRFMDHRLVANFQTITVALILIAGGFYLINNDSKFHQASGEETRDQEEGGQEDED